MLEEKNIGEETEGGEEEEERWIASSTLYP